MLSLNSGLKLTLGLGLTHPKPSITHTVVENSGKMRQYVAGVHSTHIKARDLIKCVWGGGVGGIK